MACGSVGQEEQWIEFTSFLASLSPLSPTTVLYPLGRPVQTQSQSYHSDIDRLEERAYRNLTKFKIHNSKVLLLEGWAGEQLVGEQLCSKALGVLTDDKVGMSQTCALVTKRPTASWAGQEKRHKMQGSGYSAQFYTKPYKKAIDKGKRTSHEDNWAIGLAAQRGSAVIAIGYFQVLA